MIQNRRALNQEAELMSKPGNRYDYRQRTRIEREIFALTAELSRVKLGYELGGLTDPHVRLFSDAAQTNSWDSNTVEAVELAFKCHSQLLELSPTDPSSRGNEHIDANSKRFAAAAELKSSLFGLTGRIQTILDSESRKD